MIVEVFTSGPVDTNGYLVADQRGGHAVVIDAPLDSAEQMVETGPQMECNHTHLVNTHPHWDHILDNARLLKLTHAKFGLHRDAVPMLSLPQTECFGMNLEMPKCVPDFFLEEGQPLVVGGMKLEILHCPGHCPASVVLFELNDRVVFTRRRAFSPARSSHRPARGDHAILLDSITGKLLPLGDDVRVFPGHGPATTIAPNVATTHFFKNRKQCGSTGPPARQSFRPAQRRPHLLEKQPNTDTGNHWGRNLYTWLLGIDCDVCGFSRPFMSMIKEGFSVA